MVKGAGIPKVALAEAAAAVLHVDPEITLPQQILSSRVDKLYNFYVLYGIIFRIYSQKLTCSHVLKWA